VSTCLLHSKHILTLQTTDRSNTHFQSARVCRGLYALHHGVMNSRNLGGETGTLDGPFATKHLLQFPTLGDYVSFLDAHSALANANMISTELPDSNSSPVESPDIDIDVMHSYLIEAVALGLTCTAAALLDLGVNPNTTLDGKSRLGKVKDRNKQRKLFRANPLHLACARGEPFLVSRLLAAGCKANQPDAQGSFPIHLACSRMEDTTDNQDNPISANQEDLNRLECVKMLLKTTPISIKDGNKQTILHSAARSGHCELLKYIMIQWKVASIETGINFKSHDNAPDTIYDWYDRWFRTPVHWAVLNKRIDSLRVLLEYGCSASPPKPKAGVSKRSTNVIIETPLEMSSRLYGDADVGRQISSMLINAT
jgi:ankyrin repeat protein